MYYYLDYVFVQSNLRMNLIARSEWILSRAENEFIRPPLTTITLDIPILLFKLDSLTSLELIPIDYCFNHKTSVAFLWAHLVFGSNEG